MLGCVGGGDGGMGKGVLLSTSPPCLPTFPTPSSRPPWQHSLRHFEIDTQPKKSSQGENQEHREVS